MVKKDIKFSNNMVRAKLLPSKLSMEQMDKVFSEASNKIKKKHNKIQKFSDIENLFQDRRSILLVTDEDSQKMNINSHTIK